jgi:site-specific recombinase XerD
MAVRHDHTDGFVEKNGTPSTHPTSPFVFVSERGSPFTTAGFARMIERAAASACLELKAHPHMLRHACGYALANKGHDTRAIQAWLGHRSITSTAVYRTLAPNRFKDFWRD